MPLEPCDRVKIHIVVDNYIDILTPSQPPIRRFGLDYHFHPRGKVVKADAGLCLVIDVYKGSSRKRILADGAFSSDVVLNNMEIGGIDPATIDEAYLSHGHPDHFSGLPGVLEATGHPVPLYVHPDAFIPRAIVPVSGFTMSYINRELTVERLAAAGGRTVLMSSPMQIGPGLMTTGQIERKLDFEEDVPEGRYRVIEGGLEPDEILDDTALICHVEDRGLFVISFCGHSGIINTIRHAQKITGVDKVFAVIGGFHLGHPGVSAEKIDSTLAAMKDLGIEFLAPCHCSGLIFRRKAAEFLPEAYADVGAATLIEF
jgi:7,8-dihydropterin-6-yl-methyl-4-(beta-D-ribofuranosyl)aminobenzene 5'-phosphate synthase